MVRVYEFLDLVVWVDTFQCLCVRFGGFVDLWIFASCGLLYCGVCCIALRLGFLRVCGFAYLGLFCGFWVVAQIFNSVGFWVGGF